ncbi:MAG: TetR/AcrR family transcriptional regulator [Streptosporangiaceae bacterium]|jgi:AcrR family transcriptional regulator
MDLPPALEAAWGLRDHPRKGPKPGLTLPKIIEAAIRLADRDGLEAVSMARVAAELSAAPMSLYRHVASKDDLLELMADTAWGPPPAMTGDTWRAKLAAWAWAMRSAMYQHSWALRVPVSGLPVYPNNVAWFEQGLAAVADTPLTEGQKASVVLLVSGYVRNEATTGTDIAAAIRARADGSSDPAAEWMRQYRDLMTKIADPVRFPATVRLLESGVFDTSDPPDDEFVFGLDRILDGIERLIDQDA